jgi:hypothetical protein
VRFGLLIMLLRFQLAMGQDAGEGGKILATLYNKPQLSIFIYSIILLFPALLFGYFSGAWGLFMLLWGLLTFGLFYREFIMRPKFVTISDNGVLFKYRTGRKFFSSWKDIIELNVEPKGIGSIITEQRKKGFPLTREIADTIRTEYRLHMGQYPYTQL